MSSRIYIFGSLLALCAIAFGADDPSLRVLGGNTVSIASYPYYVAIRKNGVQHCGGAIISDQHILTAGHCIVGHIARPYYGITVVSGSETLNAGGQTHLLRGAYVHGLFDPVIVKNDIGILVLANRMSFNSNQNIIPLPSGDFTDYANAVIVGFGRIMQFNGALAPFLQGLTIQIVHPQTCENYGVTQATEGEICGLQPVNHGTCQGDSGGPLVSNGQIVGVVSHGISPVDCGMAPDIYTNVFYYMDFVQDIMSRP